MSTATDRTVAARLEIALRASARTIAEHLEQVAGFDDPAGPHKLRVALRRLRAALLAFRPVLRRKVRERLQGSARGVGRILAPLRDADVAIENFVRPSTVGDDQILSALYDWRRDIRRDVRTRLISGGARDLPTELVKLAESGDWRRTATKAPPLLAAPIATLLRSALAAGWAAIEERGDRLLELDATTRHALRRDLRTLRYIAEMTPLEEYEPALPIMRKLQARLGFLSDVAMFARLHPLDNETGRRFSLLRRRILGSARSHDALRAAAASWRALAIEAARWRQP